MSMLNNRSCWRFLAMPLTRQMATGITDRIRLVVNPIIQGTKRAASDCQWGDWRPIVTPPASATNRINRTIRAEISQRDGRVSDSCEAEVLVPDIVMPGVDSAIVMAISVYKPALRS